MAANFGFAYGGQAAANLNIDRMAAAVTELALRQSTRLNPTSNLAAGDPYLQGSLFGVAQQDGGPGTFIYVKVMGIVTVKKSGGYTMAVGDPVWVDKQGKPCAADSPQKAKIVGQALEPATTAAGPVAVLLIPTTTAPL